MGKVLLCNEPGVNENYRSMNSGGKSGRIANISYFPVLIHKNDINKITDIGPFIGEDGTETNIHLVII